MIVVVTGTVGVDKKSYLEKVCQFAAGRGKEVLLCNVGDMMYAEAPDIAPGKILDIPMKRLNSLRRSVFKDIIAKAKEAANLIVNTHATFRWRHGLFPAVDFDQMRELDADIYICLIDGVIAVHRRLGDEHATEHTLKDLIVWREEEIIGTEMLCKGIDEETAFYCLARGSEEETTETFYRLTFGGTGKKAYLSFPMTHIDDVESVKEEIDGFRRLMKRFFTCFDPGDLEESYLPYKAGETVRKGEDFVEVMALGEKVRLDLQEVRQIERDINSQIYARDFLLIDQSDMIISLFSTPTRQRRRYTSSGRRSRGRRYSLHRPQRPCSIQ
jgi:adenylate kinase